MPRKEAALFFTYSYCVAFSYAKDANGTLYKPWNDKEKKCTLKSVATVKTLMSLIWGFSVRQWYELFDPHSTVWMHIRPVRLRN